MAIRVLETSVRSAVLGEVREELNHRKPSDGYRPYDVVRLSDDVQPAFKKAAEGKPADAVVDVNAVVDAYATTLKSEVRSANARGPKWLTAREAKSIGNKDVRDRVTALRAELASGRSNLSLEALDRKAALFIASHSAPTGDSGNAIDVLFPAFDVGNGENWAERQPGSDGRIITNTRDAVRLMQLYQASASEGELSRLKTFDPKTEYLIVVRDSDDETKHYPAAINKKTGEARGFDSLHNEVDFTSFESKEDFEKVFGRGSASKVSDEDFSYAAYELVSKMCDRGRILPLGEMDPPSLDKIALTNAAVPAFTAWLNGVEAIPASIDLSDDQRATMESIKKAVQDGEAITVAERHGDPILLMPRKGAGASLEDYHIGWAFSEVVQSVPELKRFYNVNATALTPND